MKIRKAKKKDVQTLVKIDKQANKEIKWWKPMKSSDFLKLLRSGYIYVAEDNDRLVGYISGTKNKHDIVFDNIYLVKKYRKKNISIKLINKFISSCKYNKTIRLTCPERLENFYKQFGFKTTSITMVKK